jgi:sterol desaturase/sphingolipid hydroxylase (fatty acid hydroxylase superfamily)
MSQEKLVGITTILLISWALFMILWERIAPYRKGLPLFRDGFWVDLVWYTIIQSYFLKILIFDYIIAPVQVHFGGPQFYFMASWPIWGQVLFFLFTHDLYIYTFHRLQHKNKWLWRTHEAHHSGKEVDFLAGARSHALEILINQTIEFLPIFFFCTPKDALIVVPIKALLDAIFGMFIHANINVRLGRWKFFFNSPELHLWHHANTLEVFHANFSTKFAFWDYLFGTVYFPSHKPGNEPENWGLYYEFPKDYFLQHVFSIYRFEEKKLLKYKWFRGYYNLRTNFLKFFFRLIQKPSSQKNSRSQVSQVNKASTIANSLEF